MKELLKEIKEHSQLILNFMWYYNILFYLLITHTLHLMKHEATFLNTCTCIFTYAVVILLENLKI